MFLTSSCVLIVPILFLNKALEIAKKACISKCSVFEHVFLTKEELEALVKKVVSTKQLEQIGDVFAFSCYRGLAYASVKKLDKSQIALALDREKWICTNRQKNGHAFR